MELFDIVQKMIFLDKQVGPEYLIPIPMEMNLRDITSEISPERSFVLVYEAFGTIRMGGRIRFVYKFKGGRQL